MPPKKTTVKAKTTIVSAKTAKAKAKNYDMTSMKAFNSGIQDLTKKLNDKKSEPLLIWVFADWCGHCQVFKNNEWDKVKKASSKENFSTVALNYDDVYQHVSSEHKDHPLVKYTGQAQYFPYFVKVHGGQSTQYQGNNSHEQVVQFMNSK